MITRTNPATVTRTQPKAVSPRRKKEVAEAANENNMRDPQTLIDRQSESAASVRD